MAAPDFWNNSESAQATVQKVKKVKAIVEPMGDLLTRREDLDTMVELLAEEDDEDVRGELQQGLIELANRVRRVELLTLLSGPNDARDCYFNIQAGTGGADACDWAEMLLRMYLRYFERSGYSPEQLSRKDTTKD